MLMVEWRSLDIDGSDDFGVYGAEGPGGIEVVKCNHPSSTVSLWGPVSQI